MANKRASDKTYMAGWVPLGLAAGIERWLAREKNKKQNRTDFLIAACLEKLHESGIQVEIPADYPRSRQRKLLPKEAFAMLKEVPVNSSKSSEEKFVDTVETEAARRLAKARSPGQAKQKPQPDALPGTKKPNVL